MGNTVGAIIHVSRAQDGVDSWESGEVIENSSAGVDNSLVCALLGEGHGALKAGGGYSHVSEVFTGKLGGGEDEGLGTVNDISGADGLLHVFGLGLSELVVDWGLEPDLGNKIGAVFVDTSKVK